MTEGDSLVISFGLLVVTALALWLSLSREWQIARALIILFLISLGNVLAQAVGAVLEGLP